MKKVLLITNMYPSKKYPHYGVFVQNTEYLLKENGFCVYKVTMKKCTNVPSKLFEYIKLYFESVILGVFFRFDVIYAHFVSHTALPLHVIRFFKPSIPIILNAHGNDIWGDTKQEKRNMEKTRKILPKVNGTIVPSPYYKDVLMNVYDFPEEKIKIFPSGGINRNVFNKIEKEVARSHCKMNQKSFYIGYISRIEPKKGWETFIKAAKQLVEKKEINNLKLLIVGDGTEKNAALELITTFDLNQYIDYRSLVSQKELRYYYNALDVFCFPSERESLGLVGLEAMSCEIPCVISEIPGTLTYAKDKINCLTFEPGNADDLEDKIVKIYKMKPEEKEQMFLRQIETVSQFDSEKLKKSFIKDFQELVWGNENDMEIH